MTEYTPCPTCRQYSHSIGEDDITAAFNHFQSMSAMPIQNAFDEQTRDAAQVLLAEITRLRADRNAVIRECADVAGNYQDVDCNSSNYEDQICWQGHCQGRDDSKTAILALIERNEWRKFFKMGYLHKWHEL